MHEHSFIQAIIKNIKNSDKVKEVLIEVGELAGIEPEHLQEHMEVETNWKVFVTSKKAIISCDNCQYYGKPNILQRLHDIVIFDCPKCHQIPKVLEGKDIKIIKVVYK
jgi:Zn finger protein HypA/HybF involved in hydrogenase expression